MSVPEVLVEAEVEEFARKGPWLATLLDAMRRWPLGAAGAIIVVLMIVMALTADLIAPYDPVVNDFSRMHEAPNLENWLGTDEFGRDVLSRLIYGARTALFVGFVSAFIGASLGLVLGVASAYFGGWFDLIFQRVMDIFMAFPLIIMALAEVSILGSGTEYVIIAITIPFVPRCEIGRAHV
jgi:peptide/nickel transport system permease protein